MSDTLKIFGVNYFEATGIKADDGNGNTLTFIRPTGTKSISANGTGIDITNYASVDVNVGGSAPVITSLSVSPSTVSQTFNSASVDGYKPVTVNAMPAGAAFTPATTLTTSPAITVNSSGLITATNSYSTSITPTVTAGYVSVGTAGIVSVAGSKTSQLTTIAATTYNVSTANQTISSARYLTGTQTIRGVTTTNLSASNVLSGVTIQVGDSANASRIATVTGNVAFVTYYTGSSAPSSSLGTNGDIYLQS